MLRIPEGSFGTFRNIWDRLGSLRTFWIVKEIFCDLGSFDTFWDR